MKNKRLFNMGLILLVFIFNMILIPSIFLIFKVTIPLLNVILASIITLITYILILRREKVSIKEMIISVTTLILIILVSIFISGGIYDTTYDSNTYHKNAVGAIANEWNPVYESIDTFSKSSRSIIKTDYTYSLWNDHYAKGYYLYAGNIYGVTKNIETGKSIYLIVIISTFLIFYSILRNKLHWFKTFLLSGLIAANPVTLCQFYTFYNDGLLGNLLGILILSLILMIKKDKILDKKSNYLLYFITLTLLINVKFTGLAYAGIFSFFFYVYMLFNKKQRKENLKPLTIVAVLSLIIGVFVIGLSTYPKNFKDHGNPFYPLYGKNSVDIMEGNTPSGLSKMNRIERFIVANFSETYNSMNDGNKQYKFKIPFTFTKEELIYYIGPDVRVGGYGVLFGGILIIATISFIYNLIKSIKEKQEYAYYLIPILALLFLIIILKDAWWARYTPELYFLPILMFIVFNLQSKNKNKMLNIIIISLLSLNSILIVGPVALNIKYQRDEVSNGLNTIKQVPEGKELFILNTDMSGGIYNIYDKHKNIKIVQENTHENFIEYKNLVGRRVPINAYTIEDK